MKLINAPNAENRNMLFEHRSHCQEEGQGLRFFFLIVIVLILFVANSIAESLVFPPYGHSYGIRKASPAKLFMFFGPQTTFDDPQGVATIKMKSRDDTTTTKDDDEVVVYGVNSGRCELIYNTSMWGLARFGTPGSGKDQFQNPKGIAVDAAGNVFVADYGNNRIVHLFNPCKNVSWGKAFSGKSATDPGLLEPSQVSLDSDGKIYVSDLGHKRIVVFSNSGNICRTFPSHGDSLFENGPSMLVVADGWDNWSFFGGERIFFCADRNGSRIWKIDFNGKILKQVAMPLGHTANYAATDYFHNVWVTDKEHHCIVKFDHDLHVLDIFGSYGTGKNQFVEPRGIAIVKRFGQVFVAEKKGAQYFWVGTDLKNAGTQLIAVEKGRSDYCLSLNLTEYSFVSLFKQTGIDTCWIVKKQQVYPGGTSINFNDPKKCIQPGAGLLLKTESTYSSYLYSSWTYPVSVKH